MYDDCTVFTSQCRCTNFKGERYYSWNISNNGLTEKRFSKFNNNYFNGEGRDLCSGMIRIDKTDNFVIGNSVI